ncbi:MAG TPA: DUF1840 domain-containing protein [Burkholderiaceae bacterium]|nr:DUF1840 domain-containing protein [Burkholderiaceae bacterium]
MTAVIDLAAPSAQIAFAHERLQFDRAITWIIGAGSLGTPRIGYSRFSTVASMALVVFRSKAAGEIYMFAETANRLLDIIGKPPSPRGVITAEQVPDALARLVAAVEAEKAQQAQSTRDREEAQQRGEAPEKEQPITLGQRAYPLIEMLRAAAKRNVDVTWGV